MAALTSAAAMALAVQCVGPSLAPVMVGISQHESGLDPAVMHRNANGTVDVGLAQVNSSNFGWLGLTMQTALDPCLNLAAGARVLLARYNGSGPATIAYARAATASIRALDNAVVLPESQVDQSDPQPPAWDLEAVANWRLRRAQPAAVVDDAEPAILEPHGDHK